MVRVGEGSPSESVIYIPVPQVLVVSERRAAGTTTVHHRVRILLHYDSDLKMSLLASREPSSP